jgi:CTP-dependent riboflavin kinase
MDIPVDLVGWTAATSRTKSKSQAEAEMYMEATEREQELTIPSRLFDSELSSTAIRTYYVLRWASMGKPSVQLTMNKLASISQSSSETQRRALRELESLKFIQTTRQPHRVRTVYINTYSFVNRPTPHKDLVVRAPNEYFDSSLKLSASQFLLAMVLYREAQRRLDVKIRMTKLESMTGSSRASINKNLKILQGHKLLHIERTRRNRGFFHENRYFLRASIDNQHVERRKAAKQAKRTHLVGSLTRDRPNAPTTNLRDVSANYEVELSPERNVDLDAIPGTEQELKQKERLDELMKNLGSVQFHSL